MKNKKINSIKDSRPNALYYNQKNKDLIWFNKQKTRLLYLFFFFFCNRQHVFLGEERERKEGGKKKYVAEA
jgi:hypothetical protein